MSYPHLSPETANECSRAAFAYSPDCYCVIRWAYADFPPRSQYYQAAGKWLEAQVLRCTTGEADRYVTHVSSDSGPELLRRLREVLALLGNGSVPDPSVLSTGHHQALLKSLFCHPMLPASQLVGTLHSLAQRMPAYEADRLSRELGRAIDERSQQAHTAPEGGGWIPSAPRTTTERPAFPLGSP